MTADLSRVWPAIETWAPPPDLTVSEWADEHGIIPPGVSGQAGNTKFRTRPPQRALLDAFAHPRVRTIDVQKSARIGWTLILQLVIGYWCHHNPRSILMVQPVEDDAKEWSKEALEPFIEDTPELAELFNAPEIRVQSTILQKYYLHGSIRLRGAQTGRGFRRFTVGGVVLDEIDAYPVIVGDDGDPISLAAVRCETVWDSVVARGSTPLLDGFSRIQKFIAKASTGYYVLACPHCETEHIRFFRVPEEPIKLGDWTAPISHVVWPDGQPEKAAYVCPDCGGEITQAHHNDMMARGYWRGPDWTHRHGEGFDFADSFTGAIGFKIWAGYNVTPTSTPAALATDWIAAKDDGEARQVYINTRLGEPYQDQGEQPAVRGLMDRCERWPEDLDCPVNPDAVTAFVDVQGEWLELEVCAWMLESRESWSLDHVILPGNPDSEPNEDVWADVRDVLAAPYETPDGPRYIDAVGIDCGHLQDRVMAYIKKHGAGRTLPLKGFSGSRPIVESVADRLKRLKRIAIRSDRVHPVMTGVDTGKMAVYSALKVTKPGPLYCHFPQGRPEEYFESLTAERLLTRYIKGFPIREWHKVRERNEALDCRVYAHAALLLAEPAPATEETRSEIKTGTAALELCAGRMGAGMTPEERRAEVVRVMRARLDRLAEYMEAEHIGHRIARAFLDNTRGPGLSRAEVRRMGHESRQRTEWSAVLEHGWIVTRCTNDTRWLEARKGGRVVRAVTHAGLCWEMMRGGGNYGDGAR